jgi:hypothetical protein
MCNIFKKKNYNLELFSIQYTFPFFIFENHNKKERGRLDGEV